jgi:manganese transport protein
MEAFIIALVLVIGVSFIFEMILPAPVLEDVMQGLIPTMPMKQHIIAIGIISNSNAQFIPIPPCTNQKIR